MIPSVFIHDEAEDGQMDGLAAYMEWVAGYQSCKRLRMYKTWGMDSGLRWYIDDINLSRGSPTRLDLELVAIVILKSKS
jgi:hypothetical protein